jgi:hydrogenase-4 component B
MNFLFLSWLLLGTGACLAAMPWRDSRTTSILGGGSAMLGCLLGLAAAGQGLLAGAVKTNCCLPWSMPGGAISLQLDGLSAFFLLPLFLVGLIGALY